jgi:hypothetical protein
VDQSEFDEMLRTLLRITVQQDAINQDIRSCIQELRDFNAHQVQINARLEITQARIETLLARMIPQSENGREA